MNGVSLDSRLDEYDFLSPAFPHLDSLLIDTAILLARKDHAGSPLHTQTCIRAGVPFERPLHGLAPLFFGHFPGW